MDRSEIEAALRRYFVQHGSDVVCAYLFGSTARDASGAGGDIDVAILRAAGAPALTLSSLPLDLAADLERLLGKPVDVVDLAQASPDFIHRVLRDGRLVHETDRSSRVAFEVRARREYFDVRPYLDEYRRRQVTS